MMYVMDCKTRKNKEKVGYMDKHFLTMINGTGADSFKLAQMFETGTDTIPFNPKAAAALYIRSANLQYQKAKDVFFFDFNIKFKMKVSAGRLETIMEAALMGYPDAQFSIAGRYRAGIGFAKDYDKAFEWMKKAHEGGVLDATYYLSTMYRKGRGTPVNMDESRKLLMISAKRGHSVALHEVGKMYENGEGFEKDLVSAFSFFRVSAENGYMMSQYHVGEMYRDGEGVEQDGEKAIYWFTKAGRNHYNIAWYSIGQMYEKGKVVEADPVVALKYYERCCNLDYYPALIAASNLIENMGGDDTKVIEYRKRLAEKYPNVWNKMKKRIINDLIE